MQDFFEGSVPAPLLESSVTGLIRRISTWKGGPGSSGPKNPQDAVKHIARISPWPSPAIRSLLRLRKKRLDELPLLLGEVHAIPLRRGPVTTAREFVLQCEQ